MILIHGRGAGANSILELAHAFEQPQIAYLAPQASGYTWYPNSFIAPIPSNEPGISSGIFTIKKLVDEVKEAGVPTSHIFLGGFSQGACLASEFVARHPDTYGGLIAFSGGLIGPEGTAREYEGRLDGVPVFLGCSDVDAHVPKWRVDETAQVLSGMGAKVEKRIYPGLPHTIIQDEIDYAKKILAKEV